MDKLRNMNFFSALSLFADFEDEEEEDESEKAQKPIATATTKKPVSTESSKSSREKPKKITGNLGSGSDKAGKENGLTKRVSADSSKKETSIADGCKKEIVKTELQKTKKALTNGSQGKARLLDLESKEACSQKIETGLMVADVREAETNEAHKDAIDEKEPTPSLRWPLVWIDLEMTGLDLEKDRILEIACIITDGKLLKMVEGPDLIINQPEELLASMGEWCQAHHTASGLVEGVRKSKVTEQEAEQQVLEFVRQHTGHVQPLLAGNSVYVDFMFLRKYMPNLAGLFPHVLVDVSSIKALCLRWFPKDAKRAPAKKKQHRALEDIKESITELKYMQKTIFKDSRR